MGIFTKKKKTPQQKSYPALIDLAIYIKNLKEYQSTPEEILLDKQIDEVLKRAQEYRKKVTARLEILKQNFNENKRSS
jgi:hypothetical protein